MTIRILDLVGKNTSHQGMVPVRLEIVGPGNVSCSSSTMQRKQRSLGLCLLMLAIVMLLLGPVRPADSIGYAPLMNDTGSAVQLNTSSSDAGNPEVRRMSQDAACPLHAWSTLPEAATTSVAMHGESLHWAEGNIDAHFGRTPAPPRHPPRFRS